MSALGDLRKRLVSDVGVRAVHAAEDGFTVGVLAGLTVTFPPLAVVLLGALGVHPRGNGPLTIIKQLGDLVREDDVRAQESYFIAAAVVGTLVGVGVGVVLVAVGGAELVESLAADLLA